MVFASICFAGGGAAIKLIPWNALAINGMRNLLAVFVFAAYILLTHHKLKFNATVLLGAVCLTGVTTSFTLANKMTTAGNAIILQYTAPVWIIVMMLVFFHKKPNRLQVITVIIVLAGITFFFYDSLSAGNTAGNLMALMSGIFYAGVFMLNQFEKGDAISSIFYGQILCGLFLAPLVTRETDFSAPVIGGILFLGFIQVGLAYLLFSYGTKYTNPVTASLINAIEPILNPVLVAVLWGEMLTPLSIVGGTVVILAILCYNVASR